MYDYSETFFNLEVLPTKSLEAIVEHACIHPLKKYIFKHYQTHARYHKYKSKNPAGINFTSFDTQKHVAFVVTVLDERIGANPSMNKLYWITDEEVSYDWTETTWLKGKSHIAGKQKVERLVVTNGDEIICFENIINNPLPGHYYIMAGRIL